MDLIKPVCTVGKEPFTLDTRSGTARTAKATAALLGAPEARTARIVLRVNRKGELTGGYSRGEAGAQG